MMMTKEEIKNIAWNYDGDIIDGLVKRFTKADLIEMYKTVYNGCKPLSNFNKNRIAFEIIQYFKDCKRTEILLKNL